MSTEILPFDRGDIHGVDSNSLLRMYDQATGAVHKSKSQQERVRNDKRVQRIAKELHKRKVTF